MIVKQFIDPQRRAMDRLVARLAPELSPAEVERCARSIVGQTFFYLTHRARAAAADGPLAAIRAGSRARPPTHITAFSLGGLEQLAAQRREGGPAVRASAALRAGLCLLRCSRAAARSRPSRGPRATAAGATARRERELGRRAAAAEVALAGRVRDGSRDSAIRRRAARPRRARSRLAAARNRRIAEARAAARRGARARLRGARPPAARPPPASGRYTWYTDAQTTDVELPPGTLPAGAARSWPCGSRSSATLNGTVTLPIDSDRRARATRSLAAQAGYRGEAARAWATHARAAGRASIARLLRPARGRAPARGHGADARPRSARSSPTRRSASTTGGSPRTSCSSCRSRVQQRRAGAAPARPRDRAGALGAQPGDRASRSTRRPRLVDVTEPPVRAVARGGAARRASRATRCSLALVEEQQRLEATATALERGRLPRFEVRRRCRLHELAIWSSRRTSAPGFVGFTLGPRHRHAARGAHRRGAPRGASGTGSRSSASCASSRQAVRATQRGAEERLAALATARAGRRAGGGEPAHPPAAVRRRPRHQRGRARRRGAARRSSAPRSPPRSTRRTRAAPSCSSSWAARWPSWRRP